MNKSSPSANRCTQCGTTLPSVATAGLCPRCLMAEAMAPTQTGANQTDPGKAHSPDELAVHFPLLEILECLGRGGMGVVYKARQKSLNRLVALKLLAPERVGDVKFAQRFTLEAQALAALNHPNIVTIHDFGQAGGFYFLLMEFVDGVNLRQSMKAGRFTPEQALAIVPPVCEALQYAHDHGIVHRDIKPENLLLDKDGRVKIADFGVATMLHANRSDAELTETQPGGTPQYMAPEQKGSRSTDHRTDIFSLGVVLYELLTGELPAANLQPPSRKVQIDVRLDEIVLRALESNPELRYQTATALRTQVEAVVSSPVRQHPEVTHSNHAAPNLRNWDGNSILRIAAGTVGLLALAIFATIWVRAHHKPAKELETNGANSGSRPATQIAGRETGETKASSPEVNSRANQPKQFVLDLFTNQNGTVMLRAHSLLAPGESCESWLVLPDGSREQALANENVFGNSGKETGICSWGWQLPPPFETNSVDEAVTQLRERWQGKMLSCPPGQPVTLFTLTNAEGLKVSGDLQFNRTFSDTNEPAVAEVRLRNQIGLLLFLTSKLPGGYSLGIVSAGNELPSAHTTFDRVSSKYMNDTHCSWMWTGRGFDTAAAAKQAASLFAQGSLLVTNGQPRTIFSVTNAAGNVFAGQFEMRGPAAR